MNTKAKKSVRTGRKPVVKVVLPILTTRRRKPIIRIDGSLIQRIDTSDRDTVVRSLKMLQDVIKQGTEGSKETFPMLDDVMEALVTPEFERDDDGNPVKDRLGRVQGKPIGINDQRIINRLLDLIEEAKEKAEEDPPGESDGQAGDVAIEFFAKADDVLYLCRRMNGEGEEHPGFYDEYGRVAWHVPEAYDIFEKIRSEADKKWRAYESGKDADDQTDGSGKDAKK